jgi:hypothetical protein
MLAAIPAETDGSGQYGASSTASLRATDDTEHAWQDVARINPNVTSRDGFWCSFSLLEALQI